MIGHAIEIPKPTFRVLHRFFTEPCTRTYALSICHRENFYSCSYSSYFALSAASRSMFMDYGASGGFFFIMLWQITLIQIFTLVDFSDQYLLSILFHCMQQENEMHSKWAEQSWVLQYVSRWHVLGTCTSGNGVVADSSVLNTVYVWCLSIYFP